MGAFLDKPKTEKQNENGTGNGLRYGLSSMQGWRVEMEDAHCAVISLPALKDWSFFAVFDGHAGARVSAHCAEQLLEAITSNEEFKPNGTDAAPAHECVQRAIKTGFLTLDNKIRELPEIASGEDKSGSTAVSVLVSPSQIFFANCGDSRGVLSRNGKVAFSTQDHKPVNPIEKERIVNAGGSVMIQRVNGSLAVSRALGDFEYKNVPTKGPCEQLVSPEPEIFMEDRTDGDEFIVLACDGIWDVMNNDEVCDFVRDRMQISDNLAHICNQVVDTCLYKGSRDNMSVVIVALAGAPSVGDEAVEREVQLDALLDTRIKEIMKSELPDAHLLSYVMHRLSVEDLPGLPPGGGLSAKRTTIEQIVNRYCPSKNDSD